MITNTNSSSYHYHHIAGMEPSTGVFTVVEAGVYQVSKYFCYIICKYFCPMELILFPVRQFTFTGHVASVAGHMVSTDIYLRRGAEDNIIGRGSDIRQNNIY